MRVPQHHVADAREHGDGVRPDRHGVVANYILNRQSGLTEDLTGDPIYDADRLLRVPTVYDVAHAAGRRTAAVDWPCTRRAAGLDFNLPFFKDQRVFESATHPDVWRELKALGLPVDRLGEWSQLPKRFSGTTWWPTRPPTCCTATPRSAPPCIFSAPTASSTFTVPALRRPTGLSSTWTTA